MKTLILWLIGIYRKGISPGRPPCCRFTPTCSEYAYTAVERWGVMIGLVLALKRILRCNPLFKGGYDPVPERKNRKKR